MSATNFLENLSQDLFFRGQNATINGKTLTWSAAPTLYIGLIGGSLFPNQGFVLRSTAYTVGQFAWPATPNGRLYKCTTAGTTGASEPNWLTGGAVTNGGTVTDGGVVWTEQTIALGAMTSAAPVAEPSGNAYARQTWTCSLAAVMGTNLAASASASTGTVGTISNLAAVQFPAATPAAWGPVWGVAFYDVVSGAGNCLHWYALQTPKVVGATDQMTFSAGTANTTYGGVQITLD